MAVYLNNHLVQSSATLFLTHPSSSFTAGTILHTFQPRTMGQTSVYGIEFERTCPNDTFSLDPNSGELTVTRTIDYNQGSFEPMCVQNGSENQEHFLTLQTFYCFVTIDNRFGILAVINVVPELSSVELMFPQTFYSSHVTEGVVNATVTITNVGTSLRAISVPVRDAIVPNYRIIGQQSSNFAVIQPHTNCRSVPVLVTSQPLYIAQQSYYEITLEAYTSSLSATTTIGVRLLDVNDESPEFVDAPELLDLSENTPIGMEFGHVEAIDMDTGINGEVRYSMSDSLSLFSVHPLTGSLFLISPLRSTTPPSPNLLTVSAIDLGVPPQFVETNITVFIEESTIFPPVIVIHRLGPAQEQASMGVVVGTIEVVYSSSSEISLTLTNSGPCECFRLSNGVTTANGSSLYDVIVSGILDFESTPNGIHVVVLNATDNMFSTVEHRVIEVTNVNEAPAFAESAYTVEVFEDIPVGSTIAHITAADPDLGSFGTLSYSISGTDPNRNLLAIHSSSGTIYTLGELDYNLVSSIQITLTAQDSGGEQSSANLVVNILDRNNNIPEFTSEMNATVMILETNGVDEPIFHFTTSDLDSRCNGAVEYSIIHAEPHVFRIDPFSGLLFPMNDSSLDYERFQFAKVVVRATDIGSVSSYSIESSLFVVLIDVDDEAPVIDPIECPCFIQEGLSSGQECFSLTAQDEDSMDLQFSILTGNELDLFRINPTSGVVVTTQTLNLETHGSMFVLSIIVRDSLQASQPKNLTIIVLDVNEPPTLSPTSTFMIPQDLSIGDFVGSIMAVDPDVGYNGVTVYSFQSGTSSGILNTFHLEDLSGDLFTRASLTSASYTFTVVAADLTDSMSSATTTVTISVSGRKNNPPSFAASTDRRTVPADLPLNSFVAQLSATDEDTGINGELTYSVVAGNHSGLFIVNSTGMITSTQSLSSRTGDVYVLNVSATDGGIQPLRAYQEFIIEVYPTTVEGSIGQLVHSPAALVCHFSSNTVIEMSTNAVVVQILPEVGSQETTYRILQSTFSSSFEIQRLPDIEDELRVREGSLFVNMEAVFLTLRAEYGRNFHLCSVTVLIRDINNNPAMFVSDIFSIQVYLGTPSGSSVYKLEAVDADTDVNANLQFALVNSGSPFDLDRDTGILSVSGSLEQPSYTLTVTVTDSTFMPRQSSTATVMVSVLQTTNVPPVLSSIPAVNISEITTTGHVIAMLNATDTDRGVHGLNRFCILSGNEYGIFSITSAGQVLVHMQLDFETYPQHYDLMLRAYDSSDNPQHQDASLSIDIMDENDEVPMFSTDVYTATVMENQASGVSVITVSALDRDNGLNGEIMYSLQGSSSFSVNSMTGQISTTSPLDRELASTYTLTVVATDQGAIENRLSSTTELRVIVLDENDEDPTFDASGGSTVTVPEDTAIDSEVIRLRATDLDDGANAVLRYSIVSGNDDFTFSVDPWTGSLTLARSLDFENSTRSYTLTFQVSDLGTPPQSARSTLQLRFDVEDVNDNYPLFSSKVYNCSFAETTLMFNQNCQVNAADADGTSSTITYSITSPSGVPFQIDQQMGILSIVGATDAEQISKYILKVQATDSGVPPLSTTSLVVITVEDINDNGPVFDAVSEVNISQNTPNNSLLFFAHAFDRDISADNSDIRYQILDGSSPNNFRVHPRTGAVFLNGSLDAEQSETNELRILARDPVTGTSIQKRFDIRVIDINDNVFPPSFPLEANPPIVIISRGATRGVTVATLSATDEEGGTISYHIIGGSGYGFFDVDTSTGAITLSLPLKSVSDDELNLIVMADDGGQFPLTTQFRLTVVIEPDDDAKPFFVIPVFYTSPPESTGSEQIFTHVRAEVNGYADPSVRYSITGGNEAGNFAINESTGAVYKSQSGILNREFVPTYNLTVSASKPGVNSTSTALLIIELADANDFRPAFVTDFNISVFENHAVGSADPFARVFAIDSDIEDNGRLSYSIQTSSTQLPFAISETTGYIYLTSQLNAASISDYSLSVLARDHGDPTLDGTVTVTVNVVQPAPMGTSAPLFSQQGQHILSEGTPVGTKITTISPLNSLSNVLLYRFLDEADKFSILPNSGEVYLIRPLDYETRSSFTHTISVTDGLNSRVDVTFSVIVTDVNELRPQFTQDVFQIPIMENVPSGSPFGSITATDQESAVEYSIVDSLDPRSMDLFEVTSDGNVQTLLSQIDREEIPVHILTVSVQDIGNPTHLNCVRLVINVVDENDNSPTFENTEIFIDEDTPVAESIFRISAFDPDVGENARVIYSLMSITPHFSVNATTGDIILESSLDAETQLQHSLVISLANPDGLRTSQVNIVITVTDVLDSTPLLRNPGTVVVQENLPLYTYVTSLANTSDMSRPVFYSIVDGNSVGHFFIEPLTGIVRTTTQLDRETAQSYQLTVQGAFQSGFETNVSFTVVVGDVNDQTPQFPSTYLSLSIPESSPQHVPLLSLNVTDQDEMNNALYVIADGFAAEIFSVDTSGQLLLTQNLDREYKFSSITFEIYAIDTFFPNSYSSAVLNIEVIDANDNPPQFQQPEYTFTISVPTRVNVPLFGVQVEATDPDEGAYAEVQYEISGGNGTSKFGINRLTGEITVTNNYQLQPQYMLTVSAIDGGGRRSNVEVTILVKGCGFDNLIFLPDTFTVNLRENVALDTTVIGATSLSVHFFDAPTTVEYSLPIFNPVFDVDQLTGRIFTRGEVDREESDVHYLVLHATDTSDSQRLAQADIEVTVLDENDNSPTFDQSQQYMANVLNTASPGDEVIRVRASDNDVGTNGDIVYSLVPSDHSDTFRIDRDSGGIFVESALNTAQLGSSVMLTAVATDMGSPRRNATIDVIIDIVDSNAPRFTRSVYREEVSEGITIGSPIVTVAVNVSSNNPSVTFRLDSDDPLIPLSLGFFDGVVTVVDPGFDFESVQSYTVTVLAEDSTTSLTGQARLEIVILDENDNAPAFDAAGSFYTESIDENANTGMFVLQVSATDVDSAINSGITYRLNPNSPFLDTFSIASTSGVIRTIGEIDYEQYPAYELEIIAEDSGMPPRTGSATVRIATINLNDNPPLFTSSVYQVTVSENAGEGTNLLFVTATDPDGLSPIIFDIVPTGEGHEIFEISSTGLITFSQDLPDSSVFTYMLNVSASDSELYSYSTVVIEIEDSNDNSPVFNQSVYTGTVVEESPGGTYITQVFATDRDRGNNAEITYSSSSRMFTIDSQSGVITTALSGTPIDREAPCECEFLVVARDGGGRTGSALVEVTVVDINDNAPQFLRTVYNMESIIESAPPTTPVLSLDVSDQDEGENSRLTFSTFPINVSPDQFPFTIDSTGLVTVAIDLNFDAVNNYTFEVSVRDNGMEPLHASENATVVISVLEDVASNPPRFVQNSYSFSVPESVTMSDPIGVIEVDEVTMMNCVVFYSFLPILDATSFDIESDQMSETATISSSDRLATRNYTIVVRAQCISMDFITVLSSSFVTVTIEVYDLNSPPVFVSTVYSGIVPEDLPDSTLVPLHEGFGAMGQQVNIQAGDTDEGVNGTVSYSIPNRETMMLPFTIGPRDGVLRLTEELDYETTQSYSFVVEATDGGTPPLTDTASVFITIVDVNDSPPEFEYSLYSVEVPEDTPVNMTVLTVNANDNDTSDVITYFLSGLEFNVHPTTGEISSALSLDRETEISYSLIVVASDGRFSTSATVFISVSDVNDNAPVFNESLQTLTLVENYPSGVTFVQLFATDADEGENADIIYSIAEQPDNGEVTINSTSGEVSFLMSPDFEISPRLEFQVAADSDGLRDFTTVAINLHDENDEFPIFTSPNYTASVTEHSAAVSNVIRVEAIDADSGVFGTVSYRIEGTEDNNFQISATGVITTRRVFDREINPFYDIRVIASDPFNMSSSVYVHVDISDINDQRPMFPQDMYEVSVSEDEPAGFIILTLEATDNDVGINARITYALSGENSNEFQRITHSNGSVSIALANELNRERLSNYNLTLRAIDGGIPEMDNFITVLVTVLDVNDNCPEFREPRYSEIIPENIAIGTTILSVEAFDRDLGGQTQLIYSIRDGSSVPEITINSATGFISVASSLDFETRRVYTLMVDVSDGDVNCMQTPTTRAIVNITLSDVNDNAPYFLQHEPIYTIEENNDPNTDLVAFDVDDQDTTSVRGRITFSIESEGVDDTFSIGATDGVLRVLKSLDRETIAMYNLVIAAADNDSPSLTGRTNVTIVVGDVNDNDPTGGRQDIYVYLLDGLAPTITLGSVFVNDSDLVNEHTFTITEDVTGPFEIDTNNGLISLGTTTPDLGTYTFRVRIADAGNEPALTNIVARIQSISVNTITENSFIMQLNNISPLEFTDRVLAQFLSHVSGIVSSTVQTNYGETSVEIQVLSIQPSLVLPQNLDVTVIARNLSDATYLHPELVQHIIKVNRGGLERYLGVSIHTELVDLCSDTVCASSSLVCSNVYNYNSTDSESFGTLSITYLGLTLNHTTSCSDVIPSPCEGIICPEPSYCAIERDEEAVCYNDCSTEPCMNGGTCILQKPGYYCSCLEGYDGRNCEQTSATFSEGTYAIFPSLKSRLEGSFSIEFIAEKRNGLLAFVGRYDDDFSDFLSVELIDGRPSLRVSYGQTDHKRLTLNSLLTDQRWHTVSVQYNSTVSI